VRDATNTSQGLTSASEWNIQWQSPSVTSQGVVACRGLIYPLSTFPLRTGTLNAPGNLQAQTSADPSATSCDLAMQGPSRMFCPYSDRKTRIDGHGCGGAGHLLSEACAP